MLMQKTSRALTNQIAKILAAMQRDFPKADVQITQIDRNPIRTLATLQFYVSHADTPEIRK
ncbi:hypothetical protein NBRC116589_18440 [Ruegeria sp. HU-ET01832]